MDLIFKEIEKSHIIEEFNCGNENINKFLKDLSLSNQERMLSKTYTLNLKESKKVIAFFTLSAVQLNTGDARIFGIDKVQSNF